MKWRAYYMYLCSYLMLATHYLFVCLYHVPVLPLSIMTYVRKYILLIAESKYWLMLLFATANSVGFFFTRVPQSNALSSLIHLFAFFKKLIHYISDHTLHAEIRDTLAQHNENKKRIYYLQESKLSYCFLIDGSKHIYHQELSHSHHIHSIVNCLLPFFNLTKEKTLIGVFFPIMGKPKFHHFEVRRTEIIARVVLGSNNIGGLCY
ncbi:hypothetical protein ACJX0J_034369 [Zea mays]